MTLTDSYLAEVAGRRYGIASCARQYGVLSSLWSPGRRFSFRSAVWLEAALVGWRSSAGRASDL